MLTPEQAVLASILICICGAVLVLAVSRHKIVAGWFAFLVTATSAVLVGSAVVKVLLYGPSPHAAEFWALPGIGFALRIYVDGLTATFLLLAVVIAVPASFYSILYMRHYEDYGVGRYYPYFLLFLAAMYGLLSTTDMMWFFFIFWQMMTLPGYALIRYENQKRESIRAANKYLLMMQIACAATMVGAELLAVTGAAARNSAHLKYDFDTVSANLPLLLSTRPLATAIAFGLFLVGFGIKMGMWPFGQIWLPDAHPAAPSPVSAMLSGVMIKTGVYGLMRYFLWLVPMSAIQVYPLAKWGMVIAVLGTITLFTGTMQALKQEQSKRLLAFHSIGQIGYILLGTRRLHGVASRRPEYDCSGGARFLRGVASCAESRNIQRASLLQRGIHALRHRHARPQQNGRTDAFHALDRDYRADRVVLHFRRALVQWIREQVEHLCGDDPGEPVGAVSGVLRVSRHFDQRSHSGLVRQVLWREFPLSNQRTGEGASGGEKIRGSLDDAGSAGDAGGTMHPAGHSARAWIPPDTAFIAGEPTRLCASPGEHHARESRISHRCWSPQLGGGLYADGTGGGHGPSVWSGLRNLKTGQRPASSRRALAVRIRARSGVQSLRGTQFLWRD